ncbi:MAG: UDP-3-O-acyl-N-acetylglucosamine deacetylase [Bacteroidia bacterium]|nr:UDP-3-O-acyl-N-acetylglucosamine deacetylase [Bacteroidales bacterium]MDO5341926.1 UDP-3-O-acyl-N-acetylglucosamine deacetylase [Bacteroidia bacterium]
MVEKQHTIAKSVSISGTGLHTGQRGTLTFHPADADYGIKFRRIDVSGQPIIDARVENVVDTSRGTTIAQNGVKVYTVEHIMASLRGLNIDNVLIDIDCEEPPIQDGSASTMVKALNEAGVVEQNAERKYLKINKKIVYTHPRVGCEMIVEPADTFSVDVKVDYMSQVLNVQEAHMNDISEFEKEFAPCRTFVFFQELEALLNNNLIKGGDLSNAIVFVEKYVSEEDLKRVAKLFHKETVGVHEGGILNNTTLYFENEPARHKLLDLVGDLTLIGMPIIGKVTAYKPGHFANTEFVKQIIKDMNL